jgi:hypothetical protein
MLAVFAEGIVSKMDSTYRSGRCAVRIKDRNPASVAVHRERSEILEQMIPVGPGRSGVFLDRSVGKQPS